MNIQNFIISRSGLPDRAIRNTLDLLLEDATIPFIARYRKELTGNLDEVEIEVISNLKKEFEDLAKRKISVLRSIGEQGALSEDLRTQIEETQNLIELEDLYLPFKKKRKTKADVAREAGLEPLAKLLYEQNEKKPAARAKEFLNNEITSIEQAFQGAQNIMAEWINEDKSVRTAIRRLYSQKANIVTKVNKTEAEKPETQKYKQYFDWDEPLKRIPSHRFLAIYRAENEGLIRLKIEVEKDTALDIIKRKIIKNKYFQGNTYLVEAINDAFIRLLKPSFSLEFLTEAKNNADKDAIKVFADNLEQLLLSPPLGGKRILGIDPGFRSGCKVVCLDENGSLLHNENIYPHAPQNEGLLAGKKIRTLVKAYKIQAIAIGNGTASRETELFIKKLSIGKEVEIFMVNEAGASVYSASKIARDEFPDYDLTVRGAVSIGRRLSDPLAELVKIDPKAIGVGQYQHEVDQNKLKEKLDLVVTSCVNRIGVNVNTASKELLSYVSGIGPALADNIIEYRKENGAVKSRNELLKVPRLGKKAYEQAAGFLRIRNSKNPLDDSAVHPERYDVVKKIARDMSIEVKNLIGNKKVLQDVDLRKYAIGAIGLPTLNDIIKELEKPGADIRKNIVVFNFDPSIKKIEDLKRGMKLPGIVNNITNFGCFVDIGIKESGLIHISKLAEGYVSDVSAVVRLNQHVMVTVLEIDESQKRIQLSLVD